MRINEIFYSLQGEGTYAGTPCVFVRFSGCNLKCSFCDTKHQTFSEISEEEVIEEVLKYPTDHIVFTGGEPTLQLTASLAHALVVIGKVLHIETNGSIGEDKCPALKFVYHVTCSPKFKFCNHADIKLKRINELKVIYDGKNGCMDGYETIKASRYYIQPCDVGDELENERIMKGAVDYCLKHPKWSLSLQTQKIIKVR